MLSKGNDRARTEHPGANGVAVTLAIVERAGAQEGRAVGSNHILPSSTLERGDLRDRCRMAITPRLAELRLLLAPAKIGVVGDRDSL